MHRRRSSVPNVPYYYKSNGKIQMTLPLVSRNPTTPITSDALSTSEITGFRKHSLDSSMDRLISSESLKAPRTTLTVDQRQKQARQKPRMSSTTSIRRLSLPTTSPTLRGTPAPGPVTSAPIVKQSSQRTGKSNSILVAAVNAFPEFRAQNEEFQHLAAKQHAKVQSAKSTSEYANANGARGSSVAVDVKTANISAVAGADVRNMNQNAGEEGPLFDMGRHSVETASRALFVPSVPEQHLRSLSIKMDLVERIPETPTNPPPAPSSSSMASDDGLIFGVSAPVKEKRKSQEGPETSRKSVWSHREGADSKTSSRKSPSKRRLKIGRSTSPKSSPSITSSAAFEANMFDIEQYVDQDLQGYYRLSY
ncbi:hypothetical protein BGZ58_006968 [Dissophora ornata]|nr:hypothetical protein BGZ58_006968 [Dissophora ornata]